MSAELQPRPAMRHDLKIWPEYFEAIKGGTKTWELRWADRDYRVGDVLCLKEFNPKLGYYTDDEVRRVIVDIHADVIGLKPGYVILSLRTEREFEAGP